MSAAMDHCPGCGVLLEASLVKRIRNPLAEESCPRVQPKPQEPA